MRILSRVPFLCFACLAILLSAACSRNVARNRTSLRDFFAPTIKPQPDAWQASHRQRYRLAYALWDVDLRDLVSKIPGKKATVERAFTKLRADLVMMRDLLQGQENERAAVLVTHLDALRAAVLRARDHRLVERWLRPIRGGVASELDPNIVHLPEDER